jgi:hypothetical protein
VVEYSAEHLAWQFSRAGFKDCRIYLCDWQHTPVRGSDRFLSSLGGPLRRIPRFRDNLLATATAS